ncbi:MAG: hypothetical protein HOH95_13950 [Dehalococcoidia bacterium]|jgi:hypothetical protein|nr:hypothetical protein [Dehalococcoidia bacterium]
MGIWVGRYSMVAGEVREHGPWLVDQLRDRDDGHVRLLVLAEPADDRSGEFCGEVAEAVAALFAREALSVTGGLLRALRQAHYNLAEWNRRSLREHQVAVGLTCVAIRDGEATVAQVGPGIVYLVAGGEARRITTEGYPASVPLGGEQPIEPLFTTATLHEQHLLLVSSSVEREADEQAVVQSLSAGPERALADLFGRTRGIADLTAVLIADLDIAEDTPPANPSEEFVEGREVILDPVDSGSDHAGAERAATGVGWPERRRPVSLPEVRRATTVGRFRGAPPGPAIPRWAQLGAGLLVITALLFAAWTLLPGLLERDGASRVEDALLAAELQIEAAAASESPELKRQALETANTELERARTVEPDNLEVEAVAERVSALLAVLDAVVELDQLEPLIRFAGAITTPLEPAALVSGGGSLWLHDAEQGRVFRIDQQGQFEPVEVYRAGAEYAGLLAAAPIALNWDQAGERLLLIDAERQLWSIADAVPAVPLVLRGVDQLGSVTSIAAYVSNLYILDAASGEVWRYLPAGDGYDSERSGLLGGIDLPEATGLAVDGDVYVLDGGTVRRFRQGEEQASLLIGIDRLPESPSGLTEDVIRALVYVADRGNHRIVVADRDGLFLRQYRHPDFDDLRAIALSADGETLYVLASDGITSFDAVAVTQ